MAHLNMLQQLHDSMTMEVLMKPSALLPDLVHCCMLVLFTIWILNLRQTLLS